MGKLTLQVEVDQALVSELEARGIDPVRFAEAGFSEAYARAKRWSLVESAKEKAKDPEGSMRRAREWAERNKATLDELRRWTEEHGVFGEEWRTW